MLDTETFFYKYMPSIMLDPREWEKKFGSYPLGVHIQSRVRVNGV